MANRPILLPNDETPITPGWHFVRIGFGDVPLRIGPRVNIWKRRWIPTDGYVVVAHPQYPNQRHIMDTYELEDTRPPFAFAAGEFSYNVWGFYVPDEPSRDTSQH